ncbi:MAG TPA: cobalt ECF transporter T component CbiQ [Firmicutes bacterium]|jgi:cobalt/nickel transport system permease protein|nr:cobalt ECF transporter T component CbiQ [Bacillota bacterium]
MRNFIEQTILDIQSVVCDLFYNEETAAKKGLLQLLEPRLKLLSIFFLIIGTNLIGSISGMAVFNAYALILVGCSRVPVIRYLKWVSIVALLFTGVVVLPSILNIVKPGEVLWSISDRLYVTKPGLYSAGLLILRTFASLSFVYLLTVTTKWSELLKSLRILRVPAPFVATLEMTERYIFLALELTCNFFMARKSRTLRKTSGKEGRRFIADAAGSLLIRTTALGDQVYQAMLSRGYTGEVRVINQFKVKAIDYLWLSWNIAFAVMLNIVFRV